MPVEPVPCAAPEPEPPIPPCCAPGIASTGLCLGDGTPISVLAVSACGECGADAAAPEVTGWLNLLTGAFTAGSPPAGTEACAGQPQQFEVGQWCDLDAAGEVIAPVLVEYEYDDTGQLIGVRTLTPAGDPYTVTGTLGICPGAVDDAEYVILCDTATDGTVVQFLRQLTPNGDGTSSTSDTLLDGTTRYTPVGRVGTCGGSLVPCGTGTGGTPGVSGPITSGNETLSSVALSRPISPATEHEVPGMGALITGGTWHLPATKCGVQTSGQDHGLGALQLPAVPRPLCDAGTVTVTIRLTYAQEGPDIGQASTGALFLMYHQPDGSAVQAGGHAFPQNTPVGSTGVREVTATIPADRLAAGQVYAVVSAETWQKSFNVAPRCKAWTFSEWSAEYAYDVTGCPDVPPPPLAQLVKVCPTDPLPVTVEPGKDTEVAVLCNTDEDGTVTEFLRAYQVDSESGQVGVVADTLLDGITPFEPLGEVGLCTPESCQDCETLNLCDVPLDTSPAPLLLAAGQAGARSGTLANGVGWTSGTGSNQVANWFTVSAFPLATTGPLPFTFSRPVSVTWSAKVGRQAAFFGQLVMPLGTELVTLSPDHLWNPATRTLSPTATAGSVNSTTASTFSHPGPLTALVIASDGTGGLNVTQRVVGDLVVTPATAPMLRTVCRDCAGAVTSVTTTALDGQTPYTPTGTVGICHPPVEECRDTSTVLLCDLDPECQAGITPTVTDEPNPAQFNNWSPGAPASGWCYLETSGQGAPVWTGGSAVIGPDPACPASSTGDTHRVIGVHLAAGSPALTGTVGVAVSLRVTNQGPNAGWQGDGRFALWDASAGARLTYVNVPLSAAVGSSHMLTLTADVPAAALAVGDIVAVLDLETYHGGGPKAWLVDEFQWSAEVPPVECEAQFLRTIVTDCATGETVTVVDTTLDGEPYEVVGDVAQCTPSGGSSDPSTEPCGDTELLQLCDVAADGTATEFLRRIVFDCDGQPLQVLDTLLDGATPYVVTGTAGNCPPVGMVACGLDPDDPDSGVTGSITTGTDVDPKATFVVQPDPISQQVSFGLAAALGGASTVIPSWTQTANCGSAGQANGWQAVRLPAVPRPACDDGTVTVSVSFNLRNDGPTGSMGGWVNARLVGVSAGVETVYALAQGGNAPAVGVTKPLLLSALLPASVLAAGELYWDIRIETRQAGCKGWTVSDAVADFAFGIEGCANPPQYAQLVKFCEPVTVTPLPSAPEQDLVVLCDTDPDGTVTEFVRDYLRDSTGGVSGHHDYSLDGAEYTVVGTVGVCGGSTEPCRDTSSTMLCDTAAQEALTVFDPSNRPGSDGWQVVSYTGVDPAFPAEAALPYDAPHPAGSPAFMGARSDLSAGAGVAWTGYDSAPHRWVLRKTFQAPEDGVAVVSSAGFRGDGGARVRVNSIDAGMYGQWNQPATTGTAQIPVTAGPNTVEIEVRDGAGPNWVQGRLDIVMTATVQFMRRTVVDCATGETVSVVDTTLDGEPYEVLGVVGQCEPVAECCEQAPPELRVDVETTLLCVRDETTGEITGQAIAERVYDDQSGDLVEQRLTDLGGDPFTLPAGTELAKCPSPDRITRQVCVVESGVTEFLTNSANATSGVDSDWQWSPDLDGLWHPMYRVAPNPAWTVTDTAPNAAHWVGPHVDRTVCPTAGETSPPVPETWYTRASWNLPADVTPESIRIAATVLNADNDVVRWRLNDGPWQPVGTAGLGGAAWTFPPTAVPGGRAGQNEIVVQLFEGQPAVTCPSPNSAGMLLHVIATYDHEPLVWTQVIEPGGQTYYLDETGARQEAIPAGQRVVACGGGDGSCCPTEECADTEVIQLCDLVYSPEPPIAVPSSGFAVTGNVTNGGVLNFSSGDAVPNGVATRTLTGLLPNFSYELLFDSGWAGGGQPAPATTNAIYRAEILDGATVLATRDRNLSNGSSTASGLAADTPLQFIAPASGTAVVRFTDLTTGGGTNRDLLIAPRTVQTQALEVVSTPFLRALTLDCAGAVTSAQDLALSGVDPYVTQGVVGTCSSDGTSSVASGPDTEVLTLCDVATDGEVTAFLRQLVFAADGTVTVTDTTLDGVTAYAPSGTVGLCTSGDDGQDCTNGTTVLLCDQPAGGSAPVAAAMTDATTADVAQTQFQNHVGPYTPLWTGGLLVYPAGTGPGQQHLAATGRVTAVAPAGCETSGGTLTVAVRVTQNGPGTGQAWDGALRLFRGTTLLAADDALTYAPPGWTKTLTVSAAVTAADLTSGSMYVGLMLETFHGTAKQWTADQFVASFALDDCASSESVQFLRTVVTDCETGAVVSTSDATLDGDPYVVTGDVGQCEAAGGDTAECCDTGQALVLCDVADDGTSTEFLRRLTYTPGIATPGIADFALDGVTPYEALGTVGTCPTTGEGRDVELLEMCVVSNVGGALVQRILAEVVYDTATGDRTVVRYVDPATWGPVAMPGGTRIDVCPPDEDEPDQDVEVLTLCDIAGDGTSTPFLRHLVYTAGVLVPAVADTALDGVTPYAPAGDVGTCPAAPHVVERCRCDDADGDGVGEVDYVELIAVDTRTGDLTVIGTYTEDMSAPYTPVAPAECGVDGADTVTTIRARRVEVAPGASWSEADVVLLQSVTATAHGGPAQVTTSDGVSTLHDGESVSWSVVRDGDAYLSGPLVIAAGAGSVTVTFTAASAL